MNENTGRMTRTPDEIKKGLECCFNESKLDFACAECPYDEAGSECGDLFGDAHAYIKQLEAQNAERLEKIKQLEAEIDGWSLRFAQQSREVEEYKLSLLRTVEAIVLNCKPPAEE